MNLPAFKRFFRATVEARNDYGERIESLRFTVPALRVGVLEYAPGELTTKSKKLDGKTVKLYYPPESLEDKDFLKSLEVAPITVGGHDSTTNESNKKIDGWSHTVVYDAEKKAAMISGVVKGNKEIAYIKSNLQQKDFGASALIDFIIDEKSGVTPDGQEYNAIARELKAGHVTLAQHVRDSQNKINVTNAVVVNTDGNYNEENINSEVKMMQELTAEQITALVKNAVKEEYAARNAEDDMEKLKAKNAELEKELSEMKEKKDEKKPEAENADEEKKDEEKKDEKKKDEEKEGDTVENAKPSQALVAAFATAMNVDFGTKTPSFTDLARLSGINEADPFARITAVNAKYAELTAATAVNKKSAESKVEVF
jgi:hypothetical protein